MIEFNDEYFMFMALRQAELAFEAGEVPIGAVAVKDGQVLARAYNQVEMLKDATAHAEILVMTQAAAALKDWRLSDVDIYVTKEPCAMCAGAMVNARVKRVIFGSSDNKYGACGGALNVAQFEGMLHHVEVKKDVLEFECTELIKLFFQRVRQKKGHSVKNQKNN